MVSGSPRRLNRAGEIGGLVTPLFAAPPHQPRMAFHVKHQRRRLAAGVRRARDPADHSARSLEFVLPGRVFPASGGKAFPAPRTKGQIARRRGGSVEGQSLPIRPTGKRPRVPARDTQRISTRFQATDRSLNRRCRYLPPQGVPPTRRLAASPGTPLSRAP